VVATLENKRRLIERAIAQRWIVLWGHDRDHPAGRLGYDAKGQPTVTEWVEV
jgi:hypothetical protein